MDFILERTIPNEEESSEGSNFSTPKDGSEEQWLLQVDGSSNASSSGADLILSNSEGVVVEYALRFSFSAMNNEVEYEVLIAGLNGQKSQSSIFESLE